MGSKVIGFRLPGDLAEELEKACRDRGIATSDFLRGLVDEALYPNRKEQPATLDKAYIERFIGELTKQLDSHSEQLKRTMAAKLSEYETEQDRKFEELRGECRRSVKRIPGIVDHIDEYVTEKLSVVKDESTRLKTTMTELKNAFSKEQTRVKDAISLGDKNETKIGAIERQRSDFKEELELLRKVTSPTPTGKTVRYPFIDGRDYKEYEGPRGLVRPYRASWTLNSESWIDLDAPLD